MKPFLLLGTRDTDEAALGEYRSVLRHTRLDPDDLRHVRVESAPLPVIHLEDYSGIIVGGSPFNASDEHKSALQERVEGELADLLAEVIAHDFPFIGLCYGVGLVTMALGGVVDNTYAEPIGAIDVVLTDDGRADPVLAGLPDRFAAFTGHKEACLELPPGVTLLATGDAAPYQMYRSGRNVYVTQFHPELDAIDLEKRMRLYTHAGYFRPDELDDLVHQAHGSHVDGTQHRILENFARVAAS
ncbi:glutamine amidotransferase [Propionicicella superfundia]|uniref:glutamine amidotransferase n=1 Tax=Propionicicella superfundia TaxID=348582 RepID=UPI00040DE89C|nr:glutamine amidotransferase [Propionicicella superfundia]